MGLLSGDCPRATVERAMKVPSRPLGSAKNLPILELEDSGSALSSCAELVFLDHGPDRSAHTPAGRIGTQSKGSLIGIAPSLGLGLIVVP